MLKKQNGITLIALIITIIVMLILVGVTINVALNGGLFEKAEQAAVGTEKQAVYEQILSNIELTNDGKISVKGTFDKVIAEFGADKVTNINPATIDENTTEVTFSIVGKAGTYNYKISTTGIEKDTVQPSEPNTNSDIKVFDLRDSLGEYIIFSNSDNVIYACAELEVISFMPGNISDYGLDFNNETECNELEVVYYPDLGFPIAISPDGNKMYLPTNLEEIDGTNNVAIFAETVYVENEEELVEQFYHTSTEYSYYNTERFYYEWPGTAIISYTDCMAYINYEGEDARVVAYMSDSRTAEIATIYNSKINSIETLSDDVIFEIRTGTNESEKENITINAGAKKINLADGEIGYIQGDNIYILEGCLSLTPFANSADFPN